MATPGITTHTGEVFPYETVADFFKSEDFLNIIVQCGRAESAMEDEIKNSQSSYWPEQLANAQKAKWMAIHARALSCVGKLR